MLIKIHDFFGLLQVLRFMSWLGTNTGTLPPWTERTTPAHDTQVHLIAQQH